MNRIDVQSIIPCKRNDTGLEFLQTLQNSPIIVKNTNPVNSIPPSTNMLSNEKNG